MKIAAGTLLYRQGPSGLEVLIVHPSGNYHRNAPWSIPKGLVDEGEELEAAARRETWEEAGLRVEGPLTPLGSIQYLKSRKIIHGFACPAPADAQPRCASWEIDRAEFVPLEKARELLHPDQRVFLDRLVTHLSQMGE